jgi:hypothetical protein
MLKIPIYRGRREVGIIYDCKCEVREMRNAETILSLIRERGKQNLPLERVYRRKTLVVCRKCHNDIHAGRTDRCYIHQ